MPVFSSRGGSKITVSNVGRGSVVQVNGMTIIGTDDNQEKVEKEFDGITSVTIDTFDTVRLVNGKKFKANGYGNCEQYGSQAVLDGFSGSVELPQVSYIELKVNSGTITGDVLTSKVDVKVNSGDVRLSVKSTDKHPVINAKSNSGTINITIV